MKFGKWEPEERTSASAVFQSLPTDWFALSQLLARSPFFSPAWEHSAGSREKLGGLCVVFFTNAQCRQRPAGRLRAICSAITCDAMREATDIADCVLDQSAMVEGLLYKYTNVVKGFQYRWFILDPSRGTLEYFMVSLMQSVCGWLICDTLLCVFGCWNWVSPADCSADAQPDEKRKTHPRGCVYLAGLISPLFNSVPFA